MKGLYHAVIQRSGRNGVRTGHQWKPRAGRSSFTTQRPPRSQRQRRSFLPQDSLDRGDPLLLGVELGLGGGAGLLERRIRRVAVDAAHA